MLIGQNVEYLLVDLWKTLRTSIFVFSSYGERFMMVILNREAERTAFAAYSTMNDYEDTPADD